MSKVKVEDRKMVLLNTVPEGACPICAVKHEPDQPHNRDSLFINTSFTLKMGVGPLGRMRCLIVQIR